MQGLKPYGVHSRLLCPQGSAIAQLAKQQSLTCQAVPYKGEHDLVFSKHIKKCLKLFQPDLVHVHSRRGADLYAAWASRFTKVPFLLTRRVVNQESSLLTNFKFRAYEHIVAVSKAVELVLKKSGVPENKRSIIFDGVDISNSKRLISRPEFLREIGLPENALVIANVGRFTENKNQFDAIEAFSLMADSVPRAHLVFFGEGKLQAELEDRVSQRGLEKRVHFAGFKQNLPYWYGGIDILLHTARLEALSVAILEAAACGIPCVAYANGGINEVVLHNRTGYLAQNSKIDQLAKELHRLLRNSVLREKMGLEARARAEELFSQEKMCSEYYALYRSLI